MPGPDCSGPPHFLMEMTRPADTRAGVAEALQSDGRRTCSACGERKSAGLFSKSQWLAKAHRSSHIRRSRDCSSYQPLSMFDCSSYHPLSMCGSRRCKSCVDSTAGRGDTAAATLVAKPPGKRMQAHGGAGQRKWMQSEALRARFHAMGLFSKWTHGAPCALLWALESLPEELWARGVVCPAERSVMLGATSKRVRELLARMQRQVPAVVRVVRGAGMEAVAAGLRGLQEWCQMVRLELKRDRTGGAPIGEAGAWRLAGALRQCSALAVLHLDGNRIGDEGVRSLARALRKCSSLTELLVDGNDIGAEGAGRLAEALGQCSSLAKLQLDRNGIGSEGAGRLAGVLGRCSSLTELHLGSNGIGAEGAGRLAEALDQCPSLAELHLELNFIGPEGAGRLARVLGQCSALAVLNLGCNRIGDEGARSLAQVLDQCFSLTVLDLRVNYIGDAGAARLAGVLGQCSALAELHLEGNGIGYHSIAMIGFSIQGTTQLFT